MLLISGNRNSTANKAMQATVKNPRLMASVGRHKHEEGGCWKGKAMNFVSRYLCVGVFATVLSSGGCRGAAAQPPDAPSLSEVVFFGPRPAKELSAAGYRQEGLPCLRQYLAAVGQVSQLWTFDPPSSPGEAVRVRRRNLSPQMVAILGQDVRAEAEAFASAVPLTSEWEGMSEAPLEEANFADSWLQERPGTPIAPFLHLFKAHRLRAGYEAARARRRDDLWPVVARRYREVWARPSSPATL
jgi:hypothetical protein